MFTFSKDENQAMNDFYSTIVPLIDTFKMNGGAGLISCYDKVNDKTYSVTFHELAAAAYVATVLSRGDTFEYEMIDKGNNAEN